MLYKSMKWDLYIFNMLVSGFGLGTSTGNTFGTAGSTGFGTATSGFNFGQNAAKPTGNAPRTLSSCC